MAHEKERKHQPPQAGAKRKGKKKQQYRTEREKRTYRNGPGNGLRLWETQWVW